MNEQTSANIAQTQNLLQEVFQVTVENDTITEELLVDYLAQKIADWAVEKPDFLVSKLYILDISEKKLKKTLLEGKENNEKAIARLIIHRLKEKAYTRWLYRHQEDRYDDATEW